MICRNCGTEMRDDVKFCPNCGVLNAPPSDSGGANPWEAPVGGGPQGGGKKKIGLIAGIAVAAVAVVALLVVVVSGAFSSPRGSLEKAAAKTAAAYRAAEEKLGMPDIDKLQQDKSISQSFSLELKGINEQLVGYDMSDLNGLGLRMSTNYDGAARKLDAQLSAFWDSEELAGFQMLFDDADMYLGSPQFLGNTFFGMNTETIGADLAELTGDDSVKDVSFNVFDLMDILVDKVDSEEMEKSLREANGVLWKAVEVKKEGARTLDINGASTKTTSYQVTVPEEAMDQYVDDLETVMSALNYYDLYKEVYQSMGMPQDQIDEIMSALEEFDVYGELADGLRDIVSELGDVELEVCVSGGYVSAVLFEDRVNGSDLRLALYLGGGQEYVDDIGLELEVDGDTIEVASSGDHGLKSGVFTDETTVRIREGGSTLARVSSEMSIDPKAGSDNFQWKLGVDSSGLSILVLETEGDLAVTKDSMDLRLDQVSVRAVGMEVCTLGFDYYVGPCGGMDVSADDVRMLAGMSEMDLLELAYTLQSNAETWAYGMEELFGSRLSDELLWNLMYGY